MQEMTDVESEICHLLTLIKLQFCTIKLMAHSMMVVTIFFVI